MQKITKIKVFVLVPFPASNEPNYKFCKDLEDLGYSTLLLGTNVKSLGDNNRYKLLINQFQLFLTALKSVLISNKKDIIIARFDILAVYAKIASTLLFRKRTLIALNIMLKENRSFRTSLKNIFYKLAMMDPKFIPTSKNLINVYTALLNLKDKKFYWINDDYGKLKKYDSPFAKGNGKIFCGGYNARDWDLIFNLATQLNSREFIFVMSRNDQYAQKPPPLNVKLFFDITQEMFLDLIKSSTLITLPLTTDSPAGLIVILAAGLMSKPVISTDTISTREYINDNYEGFLIRMGDLNSFKQKIEEIIDDPEILKNIGTRLHNKIIEMCSPESYAKKVSQIIQVITQS